MRKKIIFLLLMSVFVLSGFVSLAASKNPNKIITINNFAFKPSTLTIKAKTSPLSPRLRGHMTTTVAFTRL